MRIIEVAIVVVLAACSVAADGGCGSSVKQEGAKIIDCVQADQSQLEALTAQLLPMVAGAQPDWSAIETQAVQAGMIVGGCVLGELVQRYLARAPIGSGSNARMAVGPEQSRTARNTFEHFRATQAQGATYRTKEHGDI